MVIWLVAFKPNLWNLLGKIYIFRWTAFPNKSFVYTTIITHTKVYFMGDTNWNGFFTWMKMLWKIVFLSVSIVFPNFHLSWLSADFHILNCFHLILRQNSLQAKVSYMSLWLWKLERKMLDKKKGNFCWWIKTLCISVSIKSLLSSWEEACLRWTNLALWHVTLPALSLWLGVCFFAGLGLKWSTKNFHFLKQ